MMFSSRLRAKALQTSVPQEKTLRLPASLDLGSAQALKESLLSALAVSPALKLDASETRHVATPGVQVLLAAAQAAKSAGGKVVLTGSSPVLEAAFADLGLTETFTEWKAAHA